MCDPEEVNGQLQDAQIISEEVQGDLKHAGMKREPTSWLLMG